MWGFIWRVIKPPICTACNGEKHLIWDEHFAAFSLSLGAPLARPTHPTPPPLPTSSLLLPSIFLSLS